MEFYDESFGNEYQWVLMYLFYKFILLKNNRCNKMTLKESYVDSFFIFVLIGLFGVS